MSKRCQLRSAPVAALVVDAHTKSGLAAIRSLGAKGIGVIAGATHRTAMGLHSKYVRETFTYPSPVDRPGEFVDAVNEVVTRHRRPVVFTFSDATFWLLYKHRHRTPGLAVYPELSTSVATVLDKARTMRLAERVGVETPETRYPESLSELEHLVLEWRYPIVVKPRHTVAWPWGRGVQSTPRFAFSNAEILRLAGSLRRQTSEMPILQEFVGGEELGVEFLCREGEVLAVFAHRRIRSLSPTGGAATVKEAIAEDYKCIGEQARRLVCELRWTGPVMVEFKVDQRDGRAKLIEINGRFWGSLPLAVLAGVDFPWLYYCLATGRPVLNHSGYQIGIRSRHWLGDLSHVLAVLFAKDRMRELVYPSRKSAVKEFLRPSYALHSDVAALYDPAPAVMEIVDILRRGGARLLRSRSL
jgi:predicted ATP-grasp superfamily ATP-dependent carboligase